MKAYYVYILRCSDNSYYIGVTNNLEKRLFEHNSGIEKSCYTFRRRPLMLVYHEDYSSINAAISREKQLKGWSRKKKEDLINGKFELLIEHSKKKTSHPSIRCATQDDNVGMD